MDKEAKKKSGSQTDAGNMNNGDGERYRSLYTSWSDRIERRIARGIMLLALLLFLSQLLLQFPAMRRLLTTTDSSEGIPFHYVAH